MKLDREKLIFLIFVFATTILWAMLKLSEETSDTFIVDLEYEVPEAYILEENTVESLQVTLKSKTWALFNLQKPAFNALIHLSPQVSQSIGYNDLVKLINTNLPRNVIIEDISPRYLDVKLNMLSHKSVPVTVDVKALSLREGFSLISHPEIIPDQIKIIGPSEMIANINSWSTEAIEEKNISEDQNRILSLEGAPQGISLSEERVQVNLYVDEYIEKDLTLKLPYSSEEYYYFPDSIALRVVVPMRYFEETNEQAFTISPPELVFNENSSKQDISVSAKKKYIRILEQKPDSIHVLGRN